MKTLKEIIYKSLGHGQELTYHAILSNIVHNEVRMVIVSGLERVVRTYQRGNNSMPLIYYNHPNIMKGEGVN